MMFQKIRGLLMDDAHVRALRIRSTPPARLPTVYGEFTAYGYESLDDDIENIALVYGDVAEKKNVLVRVHSECLTGDVFHSLRCDCGQQLKTALEKIVEEGAGVLIYLRGHEGRGIGLIQKLHAYVLQDNGLDTVEANEKLGHPVDKRTYGIAAKILLDLGITHVRLMTNNPAKCKGLENEGVHVVERIPIVSGANDINKHYLETKQRKMGHRFERDSEHGSSQCS